LLSLQLVLMVSNHFRTAARTLEFIQNNLLHTIDVQVSWYSIRSWIMQRNFVEKNGFIKQALESTPVKYVTQWKQEFLGQTLQGKRVKLLEQNLTE